MPGGQVDKILRRVQSFTKKPSLEVLQESLVDNSESSISKSGRSSRLGGSGKMGVLSVLKSRSKSLSRLDSLPGDIPQGCLAVYVGQERRRFVISTKYLRHELFKALLKKCEEEFGFNHQGGLTLVCDPVLFEHLLWLIGTNNPIANTTQLEELLDFYDHKFLSADDRNTGVAAFLGVS